MRFRWKIFILLLVVSLVPIVTARTFGTRAVRHLGEEIVDRTRDRLLREATLQMRHLVDGYSAVLYADRERIEIGLAALTAAAEDAVAAPPPASVPALTEDDFRQRADEVPSPNHLRFKPSGRTEMLAVSYARPVIKLAPGVAADTVGADIARLSRLTPTYKWVEKRLHDDAIWLMTALDSGVLSVYPGYRPLPRGLDPRDQPWYLNAVGKDLMPWSPQYVDPATRQAVVAAASPVRDPQGAVVGAAAAVVPISRLFDHAFLQDKLPQATRSFLCYSDTDPRSGREGIRVYATAGDDTPRAPSWRTEIGEKWLASDEREPFEAMLDDFASGNGGVQRMPFEGCDCLWVYGRLNQFNSFLVLITPFQEILAPAVAAQATIEERIDRLIRYTGYGAAIVVLVSLLLALAFSKSVTRSLNDLAQGALRLSEGDFGARVDILSKDELGDMGRVFNMIGPRLREHARMRQSLALASEVQQTLLPQADPEFPGLDIAGRSYNCDETGGDYFDYLTGVDAAGAVTVLVGDVSGHGIASALLMTTARALVRQRATLGGSIGEIVSDVNRLLVADIEASGRFMTLFYSRLEPGAQRVSWVRAGHDPAIFYDSAARKFEELEGEGLPLGVLDTARYEIRERPLRPADILVIGTDGIWEARNPAGEMFGKPAVREVIDRCADRCAKDILQEVVRAVELFQNGSEREDDLTLVVIKVPAATAGAPSPPAPGKGH